MSWFHETRNALVQPKGFSGEQVNFYAGKELCAVEMLSRREDAYLLLKIPVEDGEVASLEQGVPRLRIGWDTDLDPNVFFETAKRVRHADIVDFSWTMMQSDETVPYSPHLNHALAYDREQILMHFKNDDAVGWNKSRITHKTKASFGTFDSLDMTRALVTTLIQRTAPKNKTDRIVAALDPLTEFYKRYAETDMR